MLANVVKIALGIVLIPIYVRHIPPADLGKFDLIMSVIPILNQLISMGLTNSIRKFYLQDHDPAYLVYIQKKLIKHTLILSAVLLLGYLIVYPYAHKFIGFAIFFLAVVMLILENVTIVQNSIYSLHENFKKSSVVAIIKDLIRYTSLILLVLFMEDKLLALFLGNLTSWFYLFFQTYKDSRPYLSKPLTLNHEQIEAIRKYSFPLLFLGLSGFFYMSLDRIMVGTLASAIDQVGYLGIAQRFTTIIAIGLGSIGTVLGIRMFKTKDTAELLTIQNRYVLFLAILVGMTFFVYVFFKTFVIRYLLTETYVAAYPIGILLLMSLFWNKSRENIEYFYLVKGETSLITKIFIFYTLLNLLLNIFFISKYDALGAVIATNIAFFLHMATLFYLARKERHFLKATPFVLGIFLNLFAIYYIFSQPV